MASDTPVRVANELLEGAAWEGALAGRSAEQQLDHWIRIGQKVTARGSESRRRIEACIAGELRWSELTPDEAAVANAELDVAIAQAAEGSSLGDAASGAVVTTVALDEHGVLREYRSPLT